MRRKRRPAWESTKPSKISYSNDLLVELTAGDDPPLVINFTEDFSDWEKIFKELMDLNEKEVLFVESCHRGCVSTGGDSKRTLELLSKISEFRIFFDHIRVFMVLYTEGGHHHPHQDGRYMGKYRLITTLGSSEKQMWFFKRNKCCGLKVPHGCMVLLSKEGGGVSVDSKVIHAVENAECSAFIALELRKKLLL